MTTPQRASVIRAPECTCSEEWNGGDPYNHTASCAWANFILSQEAKVEHTLSWTVEVVLETEDDEFDDFDNFIQAAELAIEEMAIEGDIPEGCKLVLIRTRLH